MPRRFGTSASRREEFHRLKEGGAEWVAGSKVYAESVKKGLFKLIKF